MGEFQPTHILLVLLVALLLFGGGRVAGLGKGLGQAIKNFKTGLKESKDEEPEEPAATAAPKEAKVAKDA